MIEEENEEESDEYDLEDDNNSSFRDSKVKHHNLILFRDLKTSERVLLGELKITHNR